MPLKFPRCKRQRCKRIARIEGWCKSCAVKEADRLFSLEARQLGTCQGHMGFWTGPVFDCAGSLQCCHLISRRYRNTRWNHLNRVILCGAHHRWLDTNPLQKEDMMKLWLGPDYELLRNLALSDTDWRDKLTEYLRIATE